MFRSDCSEGTFPKQPRLVRPSGPAPDALRARIGGYISESEASSITLTEDSDSDDSDSDASDEGEETGCDNGLA